MPLPQRMQCTRPTPQRRSHTQGVGKVVCDARATSGRDPVVLPYYHR
jgi:hypothetical protein